MIAQPTLVIHTTYVPVEPPNRAALDPERIAAKALGEELYELLTRPLSDPLVWGAGIPVFAATPWNEVDAGEAEHVVVIMMLGQDAFTQVRQEALDAMRTLAERGARVFPVLTSAAWRTVEASMPKPMLTELYGKPVPRRATLNETLLALARVLTGNEQYAARMFISHAKADLTDTGNAAEQIRAYITSETTGQTFFDKVSILPGEDLTSQIDGGVERGVFVAIRGDRYSSRTWCRRELLRAKQQRLPTLVVEVLSAGEARSAAYSGNGPTVVWDRASTDGTGTGRIVTLAMVECVRQLFFLEESQRIIDAAELPATTERLGRPPELVDIAALRARQDGSLVVLHPDPPLPAFERALLQQVDRRVRPVTPTTAFASVSGSSIHTPLEGNQVALSLSDLLGKDTSGELDRLTVEHLNDVTVFLARSLIGMGAAIAYGGDFRERGFTPLLARLVAEYNETARRDPDFLHSYLGATILPASGGDLAYTAHWTPRSKNALLPAPTGPVSPARVALFFSDMRRVMAIETSARVIIGGTDHPKSHAPNGYGGRIPGVVEEAWRTLEAAKPLYVAGGFGGAAKLVVDALENDAVPELLLDGKWADDATWQALAAAIDGDPDAKTLGLPKSQDDLAHSIREYGRRHLASVEASLDWNGLTPDENRTLFRTRDPLTLTALVAKGLVTVSTRRARGKLRIELVEGDITEASGLEVLVFPTFSDLDLDGTGAAIDRATGGAATRARQSKRYVASGASSFGAECVYAADLGSLASALQDSPAAAKRAAEATALVLRRQSFKRVGIVTFFGNTAANLNEVVQAMKAGLGLAADTSEFVWFEKDATRAAHVAHALESNGDTTLTRRAMLPLPKAAAAWKNRTVTSVRYDDTALDVCLLFHQANGLAPVVHTLLDQAARRELVGAPNDSTPRQSMLDQVGSRMASLLLGESSRDTLDAVRSSELVIVHDRNAGGFPYEALSWEVGGTRVRPALEGGIVRHLVSAGINPDRALPKRARHDVLGVLVVINPLGDLDGAQKEGDALVLALQQSHFEVQVLRREQATVDAVRSAIADPKIDVLHYAGHAFYQGQGPDDSGLRCADGALTLTEMSGVESVPRLCFVNACQAARVRGASTSDEESRAFAEFFLRAGVDAYLGTFWLVSDEGAATFAAEVYSALAQGLELGDAVVRGRKALSDKQNTDWANYVLYGHAGFQLVQGNAAGPDVATTAIHPSSLCRVDGSMIVASWTCPTAQAPTSFAVVVVDRDSEAPLKLVGPMRVERRDAWIGTVPATTWVVTIALPGPPARPLYLRPSAGEVIEVPADAAQRSAAVASAPEPASEIEGLLTLLDQQPDQGRAFLKAPQPSASPDELRATIELEAASPAKRALWPFAALAPAKVDLAALEAFVQAYGLSPIEQAEAARMQFQTKEDWAAYVFAPGAIAFSTGSDVRAPVWRTLPDPVVAMTHDVRDGELGDGIEVALFSDAGNGLHPALSIMDQVARSNLPYAFYLGDVYYRGAQQEVSEFFERPLRPMFDRTELFMLAGNHEMYSKGEWFQELVARKAKDHPGRQRQRAEMFRLRGPGFQIIGIDTMFVGWNAGRVRLKDYADEEVLKLLNTWLAERPDDLIVLMTTNEPWDLGSKSTTPLYESLRRTISGRVDLWFWGNVHYAALYEAWPFADAGSPTRGVVGSCIGHGGYPFYTKRSIGALPDGVSCRWLETKSRFWPDESIRPELGANGWCKMKLTRSGEGWQVKLTYLDWTGRERLRVDLVRDKGKGVHLTSVEESDLASVGAPLEWKTVPGKAT